MTHPLTPRENLTRPIVGIENRTAQEVFDIMSDRFRAHLAALASVSGDHAELARLARIWSDTSVTNHKMPGDTAVVWSRRLEAHLAENAALRAERTFLIEQKEGAEDALFDGMSRATEAERALSEHRIAADLLVSSLKSDLAEAKRKLAGAVGMLRLFQAHAQSGQHFAYPLGSLQQLDTFLSKEAERG